MEYLGKEHFEITQNFLICKSVLSDRTFSNGEYFVYLSCQSSVIATSYVWLLSTWNKASVTGKLHF